MAKLSVSDAELMSYLTAALRRIESCQGATVARVYESVDKNSNWDADCVEATGLPVRGECQRQFIFAKSSLQQQFDLLVLD
jgi:hypothetical protein